MPSRNKKYRTGLIVGKFSPLHKGHEFLIRTAIAQCTQLYIFAYSNHEFAGFDEMKRKQWLTELFPGVISFVFTPETVLSEHRVKCR